MKSTMRKAHCRRYSRSPHQSKPGGEGRSQSRRTGNHRGYGRGATEPETEAAPEGSPQNGEFPAEDPGEPTAEESSPGGIEAAYNVTGVRRKELVAAVGDFIGAKPEYLRAPTYAFAVGSYNIDKEGTLTGPENPALIESLKEQGFIAAE